MPMQGSIFVNGKNNHSVTVAKNVSLQNASLVIPPNVFNTGIHLLTMAFNI